MYRSSLLSLGLAVFFLPSFIHAQQQQPDYQQILDRLARIEQENRNLAEEVRALRQELAASRTIAPSPPAAPAISASTAAAPTPPPPTLEERVDVNQQRISEQAQTKVEAAQKLPITLTGMVLFNAFLNGSANGGMEYPLFAAQGENSSAGGATFSQSILGAKFQGPQVLGGAQLNASIYFDVFGGSTNGPLDHLVRLRTATVELDWKNTTILAGQDKPIISPREPTSLAQVAVSPLTGAGNLWLWAPQFRVEQRFALGQKAGLTAQLGVYETSEPSYAARGGDSDGYASSSSPRPALEGRFEFWRKFGEGSRIEIAPGFHESTTHAGGFSIPSHLATVDWLIQPVSKLQLTGMFFSGENAAGVGGLQQGFTIINDLRAISIGANGGWTQLAWLATKRLTFNLFAGQENDRQADLLSGDIHSNLMYGSNAIYRLGSNVLLGAEISQVRTNYFLLPSRLNNHYDLSLGYQF
ncbi:MAG: hypothetical protein ABSF22_02945 [Bryobacteraceae bacterium]